MEGAPRQSPTYLSTISNVVSKATSPTYLVNNASEMASSVIRAPFDIANSGYVMSKRLVSNTYNGATGTAMSAVYYVKDTTENTVASGLNILPVGVETPIRKVLGYLPLPITIPQKIGKVYLVGAGPGNTRESYPNVSMSLLSLNIHPFITQAIPNSSR